VNRVRKGFTLIELMIAISLILLIGTSVSAILSRSMSIWRQTQRKMLVTHRANAILNRLQDDLMSLHIGSGYPYDSGNNQVFRCDFGSDGSLRLRFIRTLPLEWNFLAQEAGSLLGASKRIDGIEDAFEAIEGQLMSTSGLCEVAYVFKREPDFALYRAVNAPPGGETSLFVERNLAVDSGRFTRLSSGVLLFALEFWTSYTDTWDERYPPLIYKKKGEKSGPLVSWDSTRSQNLPSLHSGDFRYYRLFKDASSEANPSDDVFPRAVRIVMVIAESGDGAVTKTSRIFSEDSTILYVRDGALIPETAKYIMVGDEWMEIEKVERDAVHIKQGARGLFGTPQSTHNGGEVVRIGIPFIRVVTLPGCVDDWTEQIPK